MGINVSVSSLMTIVLISHVMASIYYVNQVRGLMRYSSLRQ